MHDVGARLLDVGRLVHDHRRVARAGGDRALVGLEGFADHARAAGDQQDADVGVGHQPAGALDRGLGDGRDEPGWPPGAGDRAMDEPDGGVRHPACRRMRVEDHGVAGRDDRDRVVDDRRRRVGDRRDGANHAEGRELRDGHAARARDGLDLEVLRPRRLGRAEAVLGGLVVDASEPGLLDGEARQHLGLLERRAPDRLDDHLAAVEVEGGARRGLGCRDRLVEPREHAVVRLGDGRGVQLGTHGRLAGELRPGLADAPTRPLDDVGDLAFVHRATCGRPPNRRLPRCPRSP